jgi:hypothetical protein
MSIKIANRAAQPEFREFNVIWSVIKRHRVPTVPASMNLQPSPSTVDHKTVEVVGMLLIASYLLRDQAFRIGGR